MDDNLEVFENCRMTTKLVENADVTTKVPVDHGQY